MYKYIIIIITTCFISCSEKLIVKINYDEMIKCGIVFDVCQNKCRNQNLGYADNHFCNYDCEEEYNKCYYESTYIDKEK